MFKKKMQGKRAAPGFCKGVTAIMGLLLAVAVTAGGTLAWLQAHTEPVVNTFTMGKVDPGIDEEFDGSIKKNIEVSNTNGVPAYVRVKLLFTWQGDDAEAGTDAANPGTPGTVVPVPVTENDIAWEWGAGDKWKKGSDGFYYYTEPLTGKSDNLLNSVSVKDTETGRTYHLGLNILVDAVQATPADAANQTWGVEVNESGTIITDSSGTENSLSALTGSPLD